MVYNDFAVNDKRLKKINLENLHGLLYKSVKMELEFYNCTIPNVEAQWLKNLVRTGFFKIKAENN